MLQQETVFLLGHISLTHSMFSVIFPSQLFSVVHVLVRLFMPCPQLTEHSAHGAHGDQTKDKSYISINNYTFSIINIT